MESGTRFESALSAAQDGAEVALKSAGSLTRELRKAKAAAASGQVREIRRALDAAAGAASELAEAVKEVRASFDLDETTYMASGEYAKELLAMAEERGVAMFEEDERLLCYPSIVRVVPGDSVLEIDRRRERRLRPSVLLGLLAAAQQRPPRFRADTFLESLARRLSARGRPGRRETRRGRAVDGDLVGADLAAGPGEGVHPPRVRP